MVLNHYRRTAGTASTTVFEHVRSGLRQSRKSSNLAAFLFTLFCAAITTTHLNAADIIKIEEDWELVLTEPDTNKYSPQINLFLAPFGNDLQRYFQLQFNHAAQDDFSGGGFRVAAMIGETNYDQARGNALGALSYNQDIVRWTSVIAIQNGEYLFAVKNGSCQSWGTFGGPEYLVRMPSGENASLEAYAPQNSVDLIDIGFGKNRVTSLKLLRVRQYDTDGQVNTIDVNQGF